jgi:hypothetical protein
MIEDADIVCINKSLIKLWGAIFELDERIKKMEEK